MLSLRRWLVYVGLCCSTLLGLGAIEARQILPPAEKASDKQVAAEKQLAWKDVRDWGIEGRILPEQPRLAWFDRLPASAQGKVTDAVWKLSRDSAGMLVRFRSDSPELHVRYRLLNGDLAMPHMPATGVSGVDLYARDKQGQWRWVQVTRPTGKVVTAQLVGKLPVEEREFALYLPLYNGVESVEIGVRPGSHFEGLAPRERPIVFYGTSITQGACASRPGMVHTAILGRRFDRPVVNLGFSGNGKMDPAVGEYLGQIDAAVFVIDCLPNMGHELVAERCVPLVNQIRASRPETPIILVEDRRFTNSWLQRERAAEHDLNHAALRTAFEQLQQGGVQKLFYLEGDSLLGLDSEGATDGSHPNDLGFFRQADQFELILRAALGESK
ncbi:MAG: SGNH/GDSL hydrolase family protein [Planctomycetota bacterium]